MRIAVSGQQYIWRYQYPNGAVSFEDMVVPKDVTVILSIKSNDVAHSWWIPKLGGKFDAIPGLTNKTWFKATETGTFNGQCAEFCGHGHTYMKSTVTVVPLPQYLDWAKRQKALIALSQKQVQVQRKAIPGGAVAGEALQERNRKGPRTRWRQPPDTPRARSRTPSPRSSWTGCPSGGRAGSTGSPPPITRRSGSSTCTRAPSSSWWEASRRC